MAESAAARALAVPELLSQILEHVKDPPRTRDLYCTALINKAFHSASIKPLYSYTSCLGGQTYGRHVGWKASDERRFRAILQQEPTFGFLIRRLHCSYDAYDLFHRDTILSVAGVSHLLVKLTIFTSDQNLVSELGEIVGGTVKHLELEWADRMVTETAGEVSRYLAAFTALDSMTLIDWLWEHLFPIVTQYGQQLKHLAIEVGRDAADIDVDYARLPREEWLRLFSSLPKLQSLKVAVRCLVTLALEFPTTLRHLELQKVPSYLAASIIEALADPTYLPNLHSLAHIQIERNDEYILDVEGHNGYSLQAVADPTHEADYTVLPSMETVEESIEAALLGMESRQGWFRNEQAVAEFRALAKHWDLE